ncbi:MAG: phage portal protein [Candidatus Competibacteraceae bacterium]|nr:phage portal protein [Candidatus Competibacteraceae bacterium]
MARAAPSFLGTDMGKRRSALKKSRMMMAGNGTAYDAADRTSRAMSGWYPGNGSADRDLLTDLPLMSGRSRDLARNEALTAGVARTYRDNIVGHVLRLSAKPDYRLLGQNAEWADEWGNQVEGHVRTWMDTTECDAARTMTLIGLTHQALTGMLMNGDAVALPMWLPRQDSVWSTRLQSIESDRLKTPPMLEHREDIRGGVEIDRYGAPIAYHIRKTHPGDSNPGMDDYWRIPAFTPWGRRRVIHLYDKERPGQNRGKPIVAAVMGDLRMAGKYSQAELKAAVANSLVAAFLESDLPQDVVAGMFDSGSPADYWTGLFERPENQPRLEGGAVLPLPIGAKLSAFNPGRPATAFGVFMDSVVMRIAAGLNIPRELLLKDFSKTNYSSARAALLEAWRFFNGVRRHISDMWLNPIYELIFEEMINDGRILAPGYYENRYAWLKCKWVFAGRGWVDPTKEAQAAQIRMDSYLSTQEQEGAEQGIDWEENLEQAAREMRRKQELGLPIAASSAPLDTSPADPASQGTPA